MKRSSSPPKSQQSVSRFLRVSSPVINRCHYMSLTGSRPMSLRAKKLPEPTNNLNESSQEFKSYRTSLKNSQSHFSTINQIKTELVKDKQPFFYNYSYSVCHKPNYSCPITIYQIKNSNYYFKNEHILPLPPIEHPNCKSQLNDDKHRQSKNPSSNSLISSPSISATTSSASYNSSKNLKKNKTSFVSNYLFKNKFNNTNDRYHSVTSSSSSLVNKAKKSSTKKTKKNVAFEISDADKENRADSSNDSYYVKTSEYNEPFNCMNDINEDADFEYDEDYYDFTSNLRIDNEEDFESDNQSMADILAKNGYDFKILFNETCIKKSDKTIVIQPPLTLSLFANVPPTIKFVTQDQKIGELPENLKKLCKWKMSSITPNVVKATIARSNFKLANGKHDWIGVWGSHMKPECFRSIHDYQKINHFPGSFQIGRKDRLCRNLYHAQAIFGKQEYNFVPITYVLPQDYNLLKQELETKNSKWILKPPASARGQGIRVVNKIEQIPKKRACVVQKYLSNPYLIDGLKFDLRIYVYVTSYDPLRIYLFNDGLTRFASRNGDPHVNILVKTHLKRKYSTHELFGFDVILDENLKPWIVEVNISPSLHSSSPLDVSIKGQMIADLFNLAGHMLPDPKEISKQEGKKSFKKIPKILAFNKFVLPQSLSNDEKCKHQYFIQRQTDEKVLSTIMDKLTPDDIRILVESEDEYNRRGCFIRIFPSASSHKYLKLFETKRYYNFLLSEWVLKYRGNREKAINLKKYTFKILLKVPIIAGRKTIY
ncbi:Tubulin polyglutamylase [Brachionus plicatilis]|uniref:Tubulin polyglutamylase n=1 Tax=Brachionus plicatilis TaxID=10195 RepID=A0A3M7R4D2_BRAPC|nr:Tubulin polyglutamylase [Brachionus plicatilis]